MFRRVSEDSEARSDDDSQQFLALRKKTFPKRKRKARSDICPVQQNLHVAKWPGRNLWLGDVHGQRNARGWMGVSSKARFPQSQLFKVFMQTEVMELETDV